MERLEKEKDEEKKYHKIYKSINEMSFNSDENNQIVYDYNNRYVMLITEKLTIIGNLKKPQDPWTLYLPNNEYYEEILDFSMISSSHD